MKTLTTCTLAPAFGLLIALGFTPTAQAATVTNHSGTICKNYNDYEATKIDFLARGTQNSAAYATQVICPLTRAANSSAGATAYVDIYHYGYQTTSCTLYSYTNLGTLLGSASQSWSGSGARELSIYLGSGKSAAWSDYSVLCTIPGSTNGIVMGVDLYEY
ncbi:MAG: hypothetical protein ACKN9T_08240 [Candidatus Methylumidiphilus sp.]